MKSFVILFLMLTAVQSQAGGLCAQTFNTYGPIYAGRLSERTQNLGYLLKNEKPCEIIHLQEVWNDGQQTSIERILANLNNLNVLNPSRHQKVGLISAVSLPVSRPYLGIYRHNTSGFFDELRGVVGVKKGYYILPTKIQGEDFILVNTHLHPTSPAVRIAQLIELLQVRLRYPQYNVILTGDFNFDPNYLEHQFVQVVFGLRDAQLEARGDYQGVCTYCAENPHSWLFEDKVFDYVFYSRNQGKAQGLVLDQAQINLKEWDGAPLSDHYGLRVDWSWREFAPESPERISYRVRFAMNVLDAAIAHLNKTNAAIYEDSIVQMMHWKHELQARQANGKLYQSLTKYF